MALFRNRKLALGLVALVLVVGAGAAFAATQLGGSNSTPTTTTQASPGSFGDFNGNGSSSSANGNGSGFGGRGSGGGFRQGAFGAFSVVSSYLGISSTDLFTDIRNGQTIAQIAKAKGKSVNTLIDQMVAAEKKQLAGAVSSGRLSQSQEQTAESQIKQHVTDMVNGTRSQGGFGGFGGGGFGGGGGGGFGNGNGAGGNGGGLVPA